MKEQKQEVKEFDTKFYKKRSFWACVASGIAGILAGTAGVGEVIASVFDYLF